MSSPPDPPGPTKKDKGKGKAKPEPEPRSGDAERFKNLTAEEIKFELAAREMRKDLDSDLVGTETAMEQQQETFDWLEGSGLPLPSPVEKAGEVDHGEGQLSPLSPSPPIPSAPNPAGPMSPGEQDVHGHSHPPGNKGVWRKFRKAPNKFTKFVSDAFHKATSPPVNKLRRRQDDNPAAGPSTTQNTSDDHETGPSSTDLGRFVPNLDPVAPRDSSGSDHLSSRRQEAFRSGILKPTMPWDIPLTAQEMIDIDRECRRIELAHQALQAGCISGSPPTIEELIQMPTSRSSTSIDPSRTAPTSFLDQVMSSHRENSSFQADTPAASHTNRRTHSILPPASHRWHVFDQSSVFEQPTIKRIRDIPARSVFPVPSNSASIYSNSYVNPSPAVSPTSGVSTATAQACPSDITGDVGHRPTKSYYPGRIWPREHSGSRRTAQEALTQIQQSAADQDTTKDGPSEGTSHHTAGTEGGNTKSQSRSGGQNEPSGGRSSSSSTRSSIGSPATTSLTPHHTPSLDRHSDEESEADQEEHPPEYNSHPTEPSPPYRRRPGRRSSATARRKGKEGDVLRPRGGSSNHIGREEVDENYSPTFLTRISPMLHLQAHREDPRRSRSSANWSSAETLSIASSAEEGEGTTGRNNSSEEMTDRTVNLNLLHPKENSLWSLREHIRDLTALQSYPISGRPIIVPIPAKQMIPYPEKHATNLFTLRELDEVMLQQRIVFPLPFMRMYGEDVVKPRYLEDLGTAHFISRHGIQQLGRPAGVAERPCLPQGPIALFAISDGNAGVVALQRISNRIKVLRWRRNVQPESLGSPDDDYKDAIEITDVQPYIAQDEDDAVCIIIAQQTDSPLRLRGGRPKAKSNVGHQTSSAEENVPELSTSPVLPHQSSEVQPTTSPVIPWFNTNIPQNQPFSIFSDLQPNAPRPVNSFAGNAIAPSGSGTINPQSLNLTPSTTQPVSIDYQLVTDLFNSALKHRSAIPYPYHASAAFHHAVILAVQGWTLKHDEITPPGLRTLAVEAMQAFDDATAPQATIPVASPASSAHAPAQVEQEASRIPFLGPGDWNQDLTTAVTNPVELPQTTASTSSVFQPLEVPLDLYQAWPEAFVGHSIRIIPSTTEAASAIGESLGSSSSPHPSSAPPQMSSWSSPSTAAAPGLPTEGEFASLFSSSGGLFNMDVPQMSPSAESTGVQIFPTFPNPTQPQGQLATGASGLDRWAEGFTGASLIPSELMPQSSSPDLSTLSPTWRGGFAPLILNSPTSAPLTTSPVAASAPSNPPSGSSYLFGNYSLRSNQPVPSAPRLSRSRSTSPLSIRIWPSAHQSIRAASPGARSTQAPIHPSGPLRVRRLSGPGSMEHPPGAEDVLPASEGLQSVQEQPSTGLTLHIIEPTPRGSLGSNQSPIEVSPTEGSQRTRLAREAMMGSAGQWLIPERSREARNKRDTSVAPPQDPQQGKRLTVPDARASTAMTRRRSSSDPTISNQFAAKKAVFEAAFPNRPFPQQGPPGEQQYLAHLEREEEVRRARIGAHIARQQEQDRLAVQAAQMMEALRKGRPPSPGMRSYVDEKTGTEYIIREKEYQPRSRPIAGPSTSRTPSSFGGVTQGRVISGGSSTSGSSRSQGQSSMEGEEERGRSRSRKGKEREDTESTDTRGSKKKRGKE
ncbi:hypothetical protein I302_108382 [Kwoniella bestiolae CBS 10118]|uniref:Uncharacterized protein n=1 Tax=Kwoniella bestiolae CBS 10118 TaxID=1296100 RepID=A0A1B9FVU4_9TREE|nr:hypothetical protein I302_07244 [Kwoniella bestiolae CBS 10118]OCF22897.1 hypothetical protein I302_07244 [Kwoniella bestiolae CBS 10118]